MEVCVDRFVFFTFEGRSVSGVNEFDHDSLMVNVVQLLNTPHLKELGIINKCIPLLKQLAELHQSALRLFVSEIKGFDTIIHHFGFGCRRF